MTCFCCVSWCCFFMMFGLMSVWCVLSRVFVFGVFCCVLWSVFDDMCFFVMFRDVVWCCAFCCVLWFCLDEYFVDVFCMLSIISLWCFCDVVLVMCCLMMCFVLFCDVLFDSVFWLCFYYVLWRFCWLVVGCVL